MKKSIYILFLLIAFAFSAFAQAPFRIQGKCKPPNASTYGSVTVESLGDIRVRPCPSRSTIFSGIADFTNATVIGIAGGGTIGGSGTANFIPRFTAATTLGNTPFSWNGTTYVLNNTALNSEFRSELTPVSNTGSWFAGDRTGLNRTFFLADGNSGLAHIFGQQNVFLEGGGGTFLDYTASTVTTTLGVADAQLTLDDINNTVNLNVNGGGTAVTIDGGTNNLNVNAGNQVTVSGGSAVVNASGAASIVSGSDTTIRNGTTASAQFRAATGVVFLGDATFAGSSLEIDDNGEAFLFGLTGTRIGSTSRGIRIDHASDTLTTTLVGWNLAGVLTYNLERTITAGGTTGNQTINKPAGTVNLAAGTSTLTVTNSTVTANSIINIVTRTNDATCSVKNYVPAAGSFVINMVANCTAEASVGFIVWN